VSLILNASAPPTGSTRRARREHEDVVAQATAAVREDDPFGASTAKG
jgi:hypothetical protein